MKCDRCHNPATHRIRFMQRLRASLCDSCAADSVARAEAIGFPVKAAPIDEPDADEPQGFAAANGGRFEEPIPE